jgi:hypothetical protein
MWPQIIPAIAAVRKKPQQNPHKPRMLKMSERLRGFFLLLPDPASLQALLRAVRVA